MQIAIEYLEQGIKKVELFGLKNDVDLLISIKDLFQREMVIKGCEPCKLVVDNEVGSKLRNMSLHWENKPLEVTIVNNFDGLAESLKLDEIDCELNKAYNILAERLGIDKSKLLETARKHLDS